MNVATIVVAKQNQYLRKFEQRDATDPERARSLDDLDCSESIVLRKLMRHGVIRETADGRYYLDGEAASRFRQRRGGRVLLALLIVVTLVIVLRWFG